MVIVSGKVVGGRVELDRELPEGTSVTVLVHEGDETFEADQETERVLFDAMAQCERSDTIPMAQLLGELRLADKVQPDGHARETLQQLVMESQALGIYDE
jgi:hypothetical protein